MKKDVLNFMYYLLNKWCEDECNLLFGESLGEHIYKKYVYCLQEGFGHLLWFSALDNECKCKIIERANEIYNEKQY
jgi:hypothetical protein